MYSFVNSQIANTALDLVAPAIDSGIERGVFGGQYLFTVVGLRRVAGLMPHRDVLNQLRNYRNSNSYITVAERRFGGSGEWELPYDDIAHGKAEKTGRTGLDTRELHFQQSELILPGDVKYWGSVIKHNIVVASSGFKSRYDELVSRMVIEAMFTFIEDLLEEQQAGDGLYYHA